MDVEAKLNLQSGDLLNFVVHFRIGEIVIAGVVVWSLAPVAQGPCISTWLDRFLGI